MFIKEIFWSDPFSYPKSVKIVSYYIFKYMAHNQIVNLNQAYSNNLNIWLFGQNLIQDPKKGPATSSNENAQNPNLNTN